MVVTPEQIIHAKVSMEGRPGSRDSLVAKVLQDLYDGTDQAFQYGDVLFTVGVDSPFVHMYSMGTTSLRLAGRQFMIDVWSMPHDCLVAPMLNKKLGRFIQYFGWRPTGQIIATGHHIYIAERGRSL